MFENLIRQTLVTPNFRRLRYIKNLELIITACIICIAKDDAKM